jgi:VWFA-related protein
MLQPPARRLCSLALTLCCLAAPPARAQTTPATPAPQDDVVRVETELVQTDVMVFDGQGRFVEGLKPEQFEVRVDGKPVPVAFLERVAAGTPEEEAARAGRGRAGATATPPPSASSRARGRTVAFFIDDLHLSAQGVERVRATVSRFIEGDMRANDSVAIASASGRVGFLQQFSNSKAVARAALARVAHRPYTVRDSENITMTEYVALKIEQGDRDAIEYYVTQMLQDSNVRLPGGAGLGPPQGGRVTSAPPPQTAGLNRRAAEQVVKERARLLVKESSNLSLGTLRALEGFVRSWSHLPGRKLVFFFSDGFYINDRNTDFADELKQITDAALRSGVVIYSLDARGLVSSTDAASNRADPSGRLSRAGVGEVSASQDPLTALASDTGGRALLNSGEMESAVGRALGETANYYLLAWRPEAEEQKGGRFRRVEVSVAGRPDLKVRLPRGYLASGAAREAAGGARAEAGGAKESPGAKKPGDDLREALAAPGRPGRLPTVVSTSFVDVPDKGPVLTSSVQVSTAGLGYGRDGKEAAAVDVAGVVLDEQGKQAASFKTRLNVTPPAAGASGASGAADASDSGGVIYNHRAPLAPGLYQVRVAARDDRTGQVGADVRWVEIPDLSKRQLSLSSLHLGGKAVGGPEGGGQVQFSVDHRFARGAKVDFLAFVYNATRAAAGAQDLSAQVKVWRDGRAVVAGAPRKLQPDAGADAARIPITGGLTLGQLPPGLYELEVSVTDHIAGKTAAQRAEFEIR